MPIGLGLNPQNSDVTSMYQPQIPQQPMMQVGNMFSQQSFQQPNMTGLRNPYQSTAQDEALYNRKQDVANDPINRGLGVLANNALDAMTPSNYLKVAGVPEDIAQVGDFVGLGEIKSLYALGALSIDDFLKLLRDNNSRSNIADALKSATEITPKKYQPEIKGSYRLGKIEEMSNKEMAMQEIKSMHAYADARTKVKPMTMAEMAKLKNEESRLLDNLNQYGTPEEMKALREYNMFKRDSLIISKIANNPSVANMKGVANTSTYDNYIKGMANYHFKKDK